MTQHALCVTAIKIRSRMVEGSVGNDVIMSAVAFQITIRAIVCSIVYSGADQRKHQTSAVTGLCAGNSPVTGEFPTQRASNAKKCIHLMT